MNNKIINLSDKLEKKSFIEAECFPIDRYFLEPYLNEILSVNRNDFLLYNLERNRNTYTVQLFLCLPELWEDINVNDLIEITSKFTNRNSYYTLIQFTYRYVEINIIELLLELPFIANEVKKNIVVDWLISSSYPNMLKTQGDYLFFTEDLYGVKIDDWIYPRQRLLLDERVKPTLKTIKELEKYVKSLPSKFPL